MSSSRMIEVFCSYAHEDEKWLMRLKRHLKPLEQEGLISLWYDRKISPGTVWAQAIIKQGAKHFGPSWELAGTDPSLLLNEASRKLYAYSLLDRDSRTQTLSVHRLVQEVVRDALPAEEQTEWMQRAVTIVNATFPDADQVSRESWLPHALVCKEWIEKKQMIFPEATDLLLKTGHHLCEHARYEEAKPFYQRCLAIRERVLGSEHLDVADPLSGLGNVYSELGKYKEAEEWYRRSQSIFEQILGSYHPKVASLLNNLGILSKVQGKYKEAEKWYTQSQRIWEQSLGPEHPQIAYSLNNQAILSKMAWNARSKVKVRIKYEEVEQWFKRSLGIFEQSLRAEHPHTQTCAKNYADLLRFLNRDDEAQELEKQYLSSD